jgi:hypothetical protein
MSFPTLPTNGQTSVVNGITYSYNSATTAWTRVAGQVTATTYLSITNNTGASSTTTGALQIVGGVGIGGGLFVGGTITATNFVGSMSGTSSNATNIAGGVKDQIPYQTGTGATGFSSGLTFNGTTFTATNIVVPGVTNATSTLTGALQVAGGLAVGKDLYIGGTLVIAGGAGGDIDLAGGDINSIGRITANTGTFTSTNITSTLGVTSTNTGALQVAGGIGVGGGMFVGGVVTATNLFVGPYAVSTATSLTIQSGGASQGAANTINFSTGLSASVTSNVATVTLTTATLMTTAVNLAGGTAGYFAYQTGAGATAFSSTASMYVGNAAVANILNSGNTSTQQVGFAKNLLGNGAGNGALVYQSAADTTAFLGQGSAGALLVSAGAGSAPAFTNTSSIYVNSAVNAETLRGGTAGQIVYQSATGVTAFASSGTTGQFLQATTNGAPVFTSTGSMYVGNAAVANAINAGNTSTQQVGYAANILGGAAGSLPYQSGANATTFLSGGSAQQHLVYGTGNTLVWQSTGTFSGGTASATAVANQSVTITSGGLGVIGDSYFSAGLKAAGTLTAGSTDANTGTNTSNSLYVAGGAWIDKTLVVGGDVTFKGNAVFQGPTTNVISTNTYYTDNLLELHVPPTGPGGLWTVDDGKDIGLRFHYYAGVGNNAALVLANDTKYLEWYDTGAELVNGTFSTATYGTFQTGRISLKSTEGVINTQTGALRVAGGVGIAGGLYVGGVVTATSFVGSFSGTSSKADNIAGGTAGQLVYQSAIDTTGFVGPGTAGQILVSGGTSIPVYTSTGSIYVGNAAVANILNAGNTSTQQVGYAANVLAGSAGQIAYQSAANTTAFVSSGTTGQFLQATTNGAPTFTSTGSIYVDSAVRSNNIIGGTINQIPYQSGSGATTFGSGLTYNGTTFTTGNINVTGNTNATSTTTGALQVVGGVGIGGNLNIGGNILPSAANSQDLGSAILPFRTLYLSSSTLVLGTAQLTANENGSLTTSALLVTGRTDATSTTTGALQVAGGVGIGGGLYTGGTITANNIVVPGTTAASSTTTGALQVAGGAGIGGNLYVGGSSTVLGSGQTQLTITNDAGYSAIKGGAAGLALYQQNTQMAVFVNSLASFNVPIQLSSSAATTSSTTGALQVAGGVGIGGGLYVGSVITATSLTLNSTNSITMPNGGKIYFNTSSPTTIYGDLSQITFAPGNAGAAVTIKQNGTAATSTVTGALQVSGGVGITGELYVGGTTNATNTVVSGTTNATSTATGALQVKGGAGIGQDLYVGGSVYVGGNVYLDGVGLDTISGTTGTFQTLSVTGTNATVSALTGALTIAGGVGIGGGLYVGGTTTSTNTVVTGTANATNMVVSGTTNATSTTTGALQIVGGVGVGGNLYVGGALSAANITGSITTATNITGGTAGQLVYQTGTGATGFAGPGTAGQILVSAGAAAPTYTNTGSIYVGNAAVANVLNAGNTSTQQVGFAKNLLGNGAGNGALVYQSAADTTAFLGQGSAGALLVSAGAGSAPTFTNTSSVYVDSAVKANNIIGGTTNQIPYQSAAGATTFGSGLTYNGTTFATGNITVTGNTNASSTITGAFQVTGGAGIGGNLFVGGSAYLTGDLYVDGTSFTVNSNSIATGDKTLTLSTGSSSAALAANSGLQIGTTSTPYASWLYDGSAYWVSAGANAGGIKVTATTDASSTTTGALVVAGGAGFGGNLYVGGSITAGTFYGSLTGTVTTATNIVGGTAGQIVYQTGAGTTGFAGPGTAGQILVSAGAAAPTYTSTGSIYVGNAVNSQNLLGGSAGQFAYQTGAGATAFVSTGSMYVNGAVSSQNLFGGSAGSISYQTGAGATTFLAGGTAGQFLRYSSGSAPVWSSTATFSGGTASSSTVATQSVVITGGGLGVTGSSYFGTDVGIGGELNVSGHIVGGGVRSSSTSTVPANATIGDIWYNTSNDTMYRYTNDGSANYWVDINGPAIANGSAAYMTLAAFKAVVAAATSFTDFQSRVAAL